MAKTTRWIQLKVLLRKNWLIMARSPKSSSALLLAPVFLLLFLYGSQNTMLSMYPDVSNPASETVPGIIKCEIGDGVDHCYDFVYAPSTYANLSAIVSYMAAHNRDRTLTITNDPNVAADILSFTTYEGMRQWVIDHPNTTLAGINVIDTPTYTSVFNMSEPFWLMSTPQPFIYQIWYNQTLAGLNYDTRIPLMRSLNEAILSTNLSTGAVLDSTVDLDFEMKPFPRVLDSFMRGDATLRSNGPGYLLCAIMFGFLTLVSQLASEKENHISMGLKMMGMKSSPYWLSWIITFAIINLLVSNIIVLFGMVLDYNMMMKTNYLVNMLNFWLFGMTMMPIACIIVTVTTRASAATSLAFFVFFISWFIVSVFSNPIVYFFYMLPDNWVYALYFLPMFNYGKAYADISSMSDMGYYTGAGVLGDGYKWSHLFEGPYEHFGSPPSFQIEIPPTIVAWEMQGMCIVLYSFINWYLDKVIPSEMGYRRPLYFMFTKTFWRQCFGIAEPAVEVDLKQLPMPDYAMDDDVEAEIPIAKNSTDKVRILGLTREFALEHKRKKKQQTIKVFRAVDCVYLNVPPSTVQCLLGHNGAGKTTLVNMLMGLLPVTAGDAFLGGQRLSLGVDEVRSELLGICPQHDILFNELTPREHLEIYSRIKGVTTDDQTADMLKALELDKVSNTLVGNLSGGVKRRLSVAISFLGGPPIWFLDEPTTGMDILGKRCVWELITKYKKDRVVFLTTHSMEEADVLGDRIAIMSHGRIKALGTSLHLKNKLGAGFQLTVVTSNVLQIKNIVGKYGQVKFEETMDNENTFTLRGNLPSLPMETISTLFSDLEAAEKEGTVQSFGVSQTTLEEVFLKITNASHDEYSHEVQDE